MTTPARLGAVRLALDERLARAAAVVESPVGGRVALAAAVAWIVVITATWRLPNLGDLPLLALWGPIVAVTIVGLRLAGRTWPTPFAAIAVCIVAAMTLADSTLLGSQPLRDLHLYLKAGTHWLDGAPVYLDRLITEVPVDRSDYPFVYPPVTLPLFGAMASLPRPVVDVGWVVGSMLAVVAALESWGVRRRWAIIGLLWPGIFQGLWVGNVAVPLLVLFAWGPRVGAGLVVSPIFKAYSAIATLWLVRDRRWRALGRGIALVAALCVVTLPIVGVDRWRDWVGALAWFSRSQSLLPESLYGTSLARFVGTAPALAIGIAVTVLALRIGGRPGLARLGVATIVAAPSLYTHGFLVAIPSALAMRTVWLWAALVITCVPSDLPWFLAVAGLVAAWWLPAMRRTDQDASGGAPAGVPDPVILGAATWSA